MKCADPVGERTQLRIGIGGGGGRRRLCGSRGQQGRRWIRRTRMGLRRVHRRAIRRCRKRPRLGRPTAHRCITARHGRGRRIPNRIGRNSAIFRRLAAGRLAAERPAVSPRAFGNRAFGRPASTRTALGRLLAAIRAPRRRTPRAGRPGSRRLVDAGLRRRRLGRVGRRRAAPNDGRAGRCVLTGARFGVHALAHALIQALVRLYRSRALAVRRFGVDAPVGVALRILPIRCRRFTEAAQQIRLFARGLRRVRRRARAACIGIGIGTGIGISTSTGISISTSTAPRPVETAETARLHARRIVRRFIDRHAGGRFVRPRVFFEGRAEQVKCVLVARRVARGGVAAGPGRRARLPGAARRRGARPPPGWGRTGRTGTWGCCEIGHGSFSGAPHARRIRLRTISGRRHCLMPAARGPCVSHPASRPCAR
ncbi:hypothetical protein DM50_2528 [Burkholderia mallei]|nr:hypothetical protein DM50_2528 [Burkholderia mallei]